MLTKNVQLTAQLRTRLSYAMVKVQNGWQDRTIDEVESLASRQSSMAPPTPTMQQTQGSPRREGLYPITIGHSSDRSTALPRERSSTPHGSGRPSPKGHNIVGGQALLYPNPEPPRSIQQHSNGSRNGPSYHGKHSTNQSPRLAPAFDVPPFDARRAAQPHPPRLKTNNFSNLSNHSTASTLLSNPPSTPPPKHASLAKSPSSTTPMEQDAIETLLTMSSPGNSQHGPMYGHLPGSPLRNHLRPSERRVRSAKQDMQRSYPTSPGQASSVKLRTDEDVDRYLDQMSKDDESSDE